MFNTAIIEIVLGLILVYFLLSLLVTTLNELLASRLLDLRASMLRNAIFEMLGKNTDLTEKFYKNQLIVGMSHKWSFFGFMKKERPSYLSSSTFAAVLIKILELHSTKRTIPPGAPGDDTEVTTNNISLLESIQNLRDNQVVLENTVGDKGSKDRLADVLETLYVACLNEPERYPAKIEEWFNESMARVTGWYARYMKWITFFIGFIVVILFNANTFNIINHLKTNPEARIQMMSAVDAISADTSWHRRVQNTEKMEIDSNTKNNIDSLYAQVVKIANEEVNGLATVAGMGWDGLNPIEYMDKAGRSWLASIIGWLLTTIALMLGAPFWFDMLNKVSKLRATGTKPSGKVESQQITPPN